jgi:hypothetical protein
MMLVANPLQSRCSSAPHAAQIRNSSITQAVRPHCQRHAQQQRAALYKLTLCDSEAGCWVQVAEPPGPMPQQQ